MRSVSNLISISDIYEQRVSKWKKTKTKKNRQGKGKRRGKSRRPNVWDELWIELESWLYETRVHWYGFAETMSMENETEHFGFCFISWIICMYLVQPEKKLITHFSYSFIFCSCSFLLFNSQNSVHVTSTTVLWKMVIERDKVRSVVRLMFIVYLYFRSTIICFNE